MELEKQIEASKQELSQCQDLSIVAAFKIFDVNCVGAITISEL
jgi:Ca2+-binding EF-hand superfamily protein